jgi:hypothetical protein
MAKFHVKLKIQGFELEVDGTRDEVPVIGQALGQQLAGLLAPAAQIASGDITPEPVISVVTETAKPGRRKGTRVAVGGTAAPSSKKEAPINWLHDVTKFGTPQQSWNTADKAIWLLYVATEAASATEMSTKQIEVTFNKHFRTAGQIRAFNISRDLAKVKQAAGKESPVGQDTTKPSEPWFLTEAGRRAAQALVTRGTTTAA